MFGVVGGIKINRRPTSCSILWATSMLYAAGSMLLAALRLTAAQPTVLTLQLFLEFNDRHDGTAAHKSSPCLDSNNKEIDGL